MTGGKRVYQCPGCWSVTVNPNPADGDWECECGERLTCIDLRAASPSDTRSVDGLDVVRAEVDKIDHLAGHLADCPCPLHQSLFAIRAALSTKEPRGG